MRRATVAIMFLGLLAGLRGAPSMGQEALSVDAWREDLAQVVDDLTRIHPNPFGRVGRAAFERQALAIHDSIPVWKNERIMVELMRLVASIRDGHTNLEPAGVVPFDRWFPIRFYRFEDGVFVTAVDGGHPELAGARVLRIGTLPADSALRLLSGLQGSDNAFGAMEEVFFLSNADALHALGVTPSVDSMDLLVTTKSGKRRRARLEASRTRYDLDWRFRGEMFGPPTPEGRTLVTAFEGRPAIAYRRNEPSLPLHLRYRLYYQAVHLPEHSAVYTQINFMQNDPKESFAAFTRRVFRLVDSTRAEKLIVDLRYNGGGNGSIVMPFVHELIKRDQSVNRPGHLFALVGRKTFSAALNFLGPLKRHTDVTFVGEPMGAGLNSYGNPTAIRLRHSGMLLGISTVFWQLSTPEDTSTVEGIPFPAPFASGDYFAGRDPALATVLEGDVRPVTAILFDSGGPAARAAYRSRAARFEKYPWWSPFDQMAMNRAGYDLLAGGRTEDAVVAFELNAERFSGDWRVWDGLGDGYAKAGRRQDAARSYRRALETEPDNWNADHERAMVERLSKED